MNENANLFKILKFFEKKIKYIWGQSLKKYLKLLGPKVKQQKGIYAIRNSLMVKTGGKKKQEKIYLKIYFDHKENILIYLNINNVWIQIQIMI